MGPPDGTVLVTLSEGGDFPPALVDIVRDRVKELGTAVMAHK